MFYSIFRRFKPTTPLRRYSNLTRMFCVPKTTANTKLQLGLFFIPRYLSSPVALNSHKSVWTVALIIRLFHTPNLPISPASPIAFSKKSRYICGGESQRLTHPKGFSFVKSAEKGFECGLTPLSDGHRVSRAFITQQAVERSSAAFVVTVIYSPIVSSKRLCYICTVIRL